MRVSSVGEHNEDIYGRLLGITAQEMQALREDGVI
jgi:hypothetical protein